MHRIRCWHGLAIAALSSWPSLLVAQTTRPVPSNAELVDGHHAVELPFGTPGFRTQLLIDATAVATTNAFVTGIRFRADRTSLPLAPVLVPNVTVTMSHTSVAIGNLGPVFAGNVTGPTTIVFQGSVSLPTHATAAAGPLPWDIQLVFPTAYAFTTAQGNLLIDIVGNNPVGGTPQYYLDGMQAGGSATAFGRPGVGPGADTLETTRADVLVGPVQ